MNDIKSVARIGFVHHMLYPQMMTDPAYHAETLEPFVARDDMETFDCCLPYDESLRARLTPVLRGCGKEYVYATHVFPLRKISLATTCPQEQGLIRLAMRDTIDAAANAGASGMIFASGADVPQAERPAARDAFRAFCRWFCGELASRGMTAMLEPFDRTFDKKFLYGPTDECIELIESLRPDVTNLGIELDIAHLPLMDEDFSEAIRTVAPHLHRVHLGNCVMRDEADPFYGDRHPPMGYPSGEIDVPQLAEVLAAFVEVGYLSADRRGDLLIECQPFPGQTVEYTIKDNLRRLDEAWQLAERRQVSASRSD